MARYYLLEFWGGVCSDYTVHEFATAEKRQEWYDTEADPDDEDYDYAWVDVGDDGRIKEEA